MKQSFHHRRTTNGTAAVAVVRWQSAVVPLAAVDADTALTDDQHNTLNRHSTALVCLRAEDATTVSLIV